MRPTLEIRLRAAPHQDVRTLLYAEVSTSSRFHLTPPHPATYRPESIGPSTRTSFVRLSLSRVRAPGHDHTEWGRSARPKLRPGSRPTEIRPTLRDRVMTPGRSTLLLSEHGARSLRLHLPGLRILLRFACSHAAKKLLYPSDMFQDSIALDPLTAERRWNFLLIYK